RCLFFFKQKAAYELTEPSCIVTCVNATVAAASAAVPPCRRASRPARTATGETVAEINPESPERLAACKGAQPWLSTCSSLSRSALAHFPGDRSAALASCAPRRVAIANIHTRFIFGIPLIDGRRAHETPN